MDVWSAEDKKTSHLGMWLHTGRNEDSQEAGLQEGFGYCTVAGTFFGKCFQYLFDFMYKNSE